MIDPKTEFQLQNSFFSQETEDRFKVSSYYISEHLSYFKGHFPDKPILPAVAIIDCAQEIMSTLIFKKKLLLSEVQYSKFMGTIEPKMIIDIQISRVSNEKWIFIFSQKEKNLAELCMIFEGL